MTRCRAAIVLVLACGVCGALSPSPAAAGGWEFPADGTRGLGRGGARMARADDPAVMTRNPAALALMWDDMAILGAHLLLVDSCMQPTGGYRWGITGNGAIDLGDGPVLLSADEGDTDLEGKPVQGLSDEAYPEVCYEGPAPFLPHLALSNKVSDDLGVGIGFFPPDNAALYQWGNRDGTVDTKDGKRPNPLRYYRSHQNVSFFSVLGAAGYRLAPWISVGAGLQWSLAVYSATTWSTALPTLDPQSDVKTEVFGRDLFVPGVIASVHLQPWDFLDVVVGFKWADRVKSKVKLDITTGAFGTGEVFEYNDASTGQVRSVGSAIPFTTHNQPGALDSPPIWAPQLSVGVRYSDLLKPRVPDTKLAHRYAEGKVEDSMATELWDLELDLVYYFSSVYDRAQFTAGDATAYVKGISPEGFVAAPLESKVGECTEIAADMQTCIGDRVVKTDYFGKDQLTARLGGDYNVLPGVLALRAGVSYETAAQDPELLNVLSYMLSRVGIHGGFTARVADATDISFGYAHFIHQDVKLQVASGDATAAYPDQLKTDQFHFEPGSGVGGMGGMNTGAEGGDFDGVAGVEIQNPSTSYTEGPFYVNAGTYYFHLDVVSLSIAQHF